MSVMTAEEQRRRAAATRGRALVTAVPGQQTVTARDLGRARRRHDGRRAAAGHGTRHLTVVPPTRHRERHGRRQR